MADAGVRLRAGEKRPVYGTVEALSGTVQVQGTPACTLYDRAGQAVPGMSGVPATGWDSAAAQEVRAWLNLDTSTLAAGHYTLEFTIQALGSDTLVRTYRPSVAVQVLAA
jgi:hypothetical protein